MPDVAVRPLKSDDDTSEAQGPPPREEVTQLRKTAVATLVVCMVALVFASVPVAAVPPSDSEPLRCDMAATLDLSQADAHWVGPVTGCDIQGTMEVFETPANFIVGNSEHFFETFTITTSTGVISGVDKGVWDFNTFKFRANGWITDATDDWSYLMGYKLHESGYTSQFPPTQGTIVTLTAAMFLVAP